MESLAVGALVVFIGLAALAIGYFIGLILLPY